MRKAYLYENGKCTVAYNLHFTTRIEEGASQEDIENGDAYETVGVLQDEDGDILCEYTDMDMLRRHLSFVFTPEAAEELMK